MARHKEFDRDTALKAAITVFTEHGYEGTSTDALLSAMKISRQSMYDTFGDKRSLYLAALDRYNSDSVSALLADLQRDGTPLKALEETLIAFASRPETEAGRGCLGVSAVCEFGRTDSEVSALTDKASRRLSAAIQTILEEGQGRGEIGTDIDTTDAVQFLGSTLSGMKVSARNGASPETLRGIARLAIRSLR
ncbi:AcrR family transcriptional regulator [Rhizobium sp. BK529]|uniref:TetR/AcrR family transcriptional regulator n=1 Tax=unclassified Rhizobium TaxID=2613769 RepID=UPI0010510A1B|nr:MULTISPECIES: TetR/AcrR family transcriptional regulator [unclassified Rhizobium]MBB3595521.1 AcrR family transcriptional regulator [Rhizobium sp. BK529]TCS00689.1 TetR family transcriptional regulator [Rhizobium sp. BK418]